MLSRLAVTLLALGALFFGASDTFAQAVTVQGEGNQASDAAMSERLLTGAITPRCRPMTKGDGTIVVCGGKEASDKERIPLRGETDGAKSTDDGVPRAPNVSGLRDCSRGCLSLGGVPAPIYYFDIKSLPEAPAGSDADLIARGEIPAP